MKATFFNTTLVAFFLMVMATNKISAQNLPFEKDSWNMTIEQAADIFENGDNANALNCPVDTFRKAIRECFNGNRTKILSDSANKAMAKRPAFSDAQIVWMMRHSYKDTIAFKKGEMLIGRVIPKKPHNTYNLFERGPYGVGGNDSVEVAYVYRAPKGGTVETAWMFDGCKNPAIDRRPAKGNKKPTPAPNTDPVVKKPSDTPDDYVMKAGGDDGAVIRIPKDSLYAGSGNIIIPININAGNNNGNNNGNGSTASSARRDSVVIRLVPTSTYVPQDNQGYHASGPGYPTQEQMRYYGYYDPRYGSQPRYVYRNNNGWYFLGGAIVGAGTALLLDQLYGGGRGGSTVIYNTAIANATNTGGGYTPGGGTNPPNSPSPTGGPFNPNN